MLDAAIAFLESLQRYELAMLARECTVEIVELENRGYFGGVVRTREVAFNAPPPVDEALQALSDIDRKRLFEAVATVAEDLSSEEETILVRRSTERKCSAAAEILSDLIIHRAMMKSVATGGARIQEVDDYYKARELRLRSAVSSEVAYANPYPSLWDWYNHWSKELPHYWQRRQAIDQLFGPVIDAVARRPRITAPQREETGWERVDRALAKARQMLERASAEEDFQTIGLMCREVTISLAQAVYDPVRHPPVDGVVIGPADANRMLDAFFAVEFQGSSEKEVRAHARASLALSLNLQHRRTATRTLAALCLEATSSTVAVVSITARDASAGVS